MPTYAVGIDSGTQGTKALVVDAATGRVLGRGRAPHAMVEGPRPRGERAGPGGLGRGGPERPWPPR